MSLQRYEVVTSVPMKLTLFGREVIADVIGYGKMRSYWGRVAPKPIGLRREPTGTEETPWDNGSRHDSYVAMSQGTRKMVHIPQS